MKVSSGFIPHPPSNTAPHLNCPCSAVHSQPLHRAVPPQACTWTCCLATSRPCTALCSPAPCGGPTKWTQRKGVPTPSTGPQAPGARSCTGSTVLPGGWRLSGVWSTTTPARYWGGTRGSLQMASMRGPSPRPRASTIQSRARRSSPRACLRTSAGRPWQRLRQVAAAVVAQQQQRLLRRQALKRCSSSLRPDGPYPSCLL